LSNGSVIHEAGIARFSRAIGKTALRPRNKILHHDIDLKANLTIKNSYYKVSEQYLSLEGRFNTGIKIIGGLNFGP
jgi:hypothetical protein